jgi:hypothetical protein
LQSDFGILEGDPSSRPALCKNFAGASKWGTRFQGDGSGAAWLAIGVTQAMRRG